MNTGGEYGQPLSRHTEVHAPVVSSLVTVRLRANGTLPQDSSDQLSSTQVRLINSGNVSVGAKLRETDDYVNGPFSDLGTTQTLVPGGQKLQTVFPRRQYLELVGTTGTGEVKMTVISQIRYEKLGFAKTDGQYPQGITNSNVPGWSSL
jgi:hypothetical protein